MRGCRLASRKDQVFVNAIDQNAVAPLSFGRKADFLVELGRDRVALRRSRGTDDGFQYGLALSEQFDRSHRLGNVLIPPLAEWTGNNYLGRTPRTTD